MYKYAVNLNDNKTICDCETIWNADVGWTEEVYTGEIYACKIVECPYDDACVSDFYEDGEGIKFDEEKYQERIKQKQLDKIKKDQQSMFNSIMKTTMLKSMDDNQAYQMRYLYSDFDPNGHEYKKDDRFLWSENNKFYKVLQDHTSQDSPDRMPDVAVSLYVEIPDPSIEWPEWKQPTGAHDAYSIGDKVSYNKEHYISQIDGNTTVPGSDERWWKKVVEAVEEPDPEEPSEPEVDEYPEWKQPTGAHDAYHRGDKITFNGKKYECIAPEGVAVVWDPVTYPAYWQEVKADAE